MDLGIKHGPGTGFGDAAAGDPVPSSPRTFEEKDSAWAPRIFDGGIFVPTQSGTVTAFFPDGSTASCFRRTVHGHSRSLEEPALIFSWSPEIFDAEQSFDDLAVTSFVLWINSPSPWSTVSVWLYRDVSPGPEPSRYVLLLAGLALVGHAAGRRQRSSTLGPTEQ